MTEKNYQITHLNIVVSWSVWPWNDARMWLVYFRSLCLEPPTHTANKTIYAPLQFSCNERTTCGKTTSANKKKKLKLRARNPTRGVSVVDRTKNEIIHFCIILYIYRYMRKNRQQLQKSRAEGRKATTASCMYIWMAFGRLDEECVWMLIVFRLLLLLYFWWINKQVGIILEEN
jgi:hypothetical protein